MNKNLHFNLKASYESPLVEVMEVSLVDAILNSSIQEHTLESMNVKDTSHWEWDD